eukprot:8667180-Pyramimonas_sp.AAC.1
MGTAAATVAGAVPGTSRASSSAGGGRAEAQGSRRRSLALRPADSLRGACPGFAAHGRTLSAASGYTVHERVRRLDGDTRCFGG